MLAEWFFGNTRVILRLGRQCTWGVASVPIQVLTDADVDEFYNICSRHAEASALPALKFGFGHFGDPADMQWATVIRPGSWNVFAALKFRIWHEFATLYSCLDTLPNFYVVVSQPTQDDADLTDNVKSRHDADIPRLRRHFLNRDFNATSEDQTIAQATTPSRVITPSTSHVRARPSAASSSANADAPGPPLRRGPSKCRTCSSGECSHVRQDNSLSNMADGSAMYSIRPDSASHPYRDGGPQAPSTQGHPYQAGAQPPVNSSSVVQRNTSSPSPTTEVIIRLQKDEQGRFGPAHPKTVLNPKITNAQFFAWFAGVTRHGLPDGPPQLRFTFKDAMPVPKVNVIAQGNEEHFTYMRKDIRAEFDRATAYMPGMREFVVLVSAPDWGPGAAESDEDNWF